MKKICTCLAVLLLQTVQAQKTEINIGVNGNVSFFRGNHALASTAIYISDVPASIPDASGGIYGKRAGVGWGVDLVVQRVGKTGLIAGLAGGFERLTSRIRVTEVGSRVMVPATGTVTTTHTFINFYPYVGKRFKVGKQAFDIHLGLDVALPLSAHEKGTATANGSTVETDVDHRKPGIDLRPRLQLRWSHRHIGFSASYAIGLTNYGGNMAGTNPGAYVNTGRLGVFFRL